MTARVVILAAVAMALAGCAAFPDSPIPRLPPGPYDRCGGQVLMTYSIDADGQLAADWCHNHDTRGAR